MHAVPHIVASLAEPHGVSERASGAEGLQHEPKPTYLSRRPMGRRMLLGAGLGAALVAMPDMAHAAGAGTVGLSDKEWQERLSPEAYQVGDEAARPWCIAWKLVQPRQPCPARLGVQPRLPCPALPCGA